MSGRQEDLGFRMRTVALEVVVDPRPTIFLIEDNNLMRTSLTWLFESHGYKVVAAASPADAIRLYDPERAGCLVLDVQLPRMSGIDLYKLLRKRGAVHPFIMITAYGSIPKAVQAMRLGAIDFIEKPFQQTYLLERVRQAIDTDQDRRRVEKEQRELAARLEGLSPREWQVARLVTSGKSTQAIADSLQIKFKTVETHRRNIGKKLHIDTAAELGAIISKADALRAQGLIDFSV